MRVVLAAVLILAAQADSGESFVRHHKGKTWTYRSLVRQEDLKHTLKITYEVLEADDRRVLLKATTAQELDALETSQESKFEWALRDGFVTWSSVGEKPTVINLFRPGAKKGDTWKSRGFSNEEAEAQYLGTEEVTVPAGTWKDAHVVTFRGQSQVRDDKMEDFVYRCWLVPGVGVVKLEWTWAHWSLKNELVSIKEPK